MNKLDEAIWHYYRYHKLNSFFLRQPIAVRLLPVKRQILHATEAESSCH